VPGGGGLGGGGARLLGAAAGGAGLGDDEVAPGLQGERPEGEVADDAADEGAQPDVEHRRARAPR
jgi:hypothetical protein